MCGIIGYVGSSEVVPVLLDGLRSLGFETFLPDDLQAPAYRAFMTLLEAVSKDATDDLDWLLANRLLREQMDSW